MILRNSALTSISMVAENDTPICLFPSPRLQHPILSINYIETRIHFPLPHTVCATMNIVVISVALYHIHAIHRHAFTACMYSVGSVSSHQFVKTPFFTR